MQCAQCGRPLAAGLKFCPNCGHPAGESAAHSPPAPPPGAPVAPGRRRRRWPLVVALGLILGGVAGAVAILAFIGGESSGGSDDVLVALVDRDGDREIHRIRFGDELTADTEVVDDVRFEGGSVGSADRPGEPERDGLRVGERRSEQGLFVPGGDALIAFVDRRGDHVVLLAPPSGEAVEVFDDEERASAIVGPGGEIVLLDGEGGCHLLADPGTPPRRLARRDCRLAFDGERLEAFEVEDQFTDELTLTRLSFDDTADTSYEVQGESIRYSQQLTVDGQRYAIFEDGLDDDLSEVLVYDEASEEVASSARLRFRTLRAQRNGGVLVGGDTRIGDRTYEVWSPELGFVEVATEFLAAAAWVGDGHVAAIAGDLETQTLTLFDVATGERTTVMEGEALAIVPMADDPRALIASFDGDDAALSILESGAAPIELGEIRNVGALSAGQVAGSDTIWVSTRDEGRSTLRAVPVGGGGIDDFGDWAELRPLASTLDGRRLIVSAIEEDGDDAVWKVWLFDADGSAPIELDDDLDDVLNGAVRGEELIYTAIVGDDVDDVEVRRVPLDGSERPTTVYDDAELMAVGWGYSSGPSFSGATEGVGDLACDAVGALRIGDSAEGRLDQGEDVCYVLRVASSSDAVTISVEGFDEIDPRLELWSRGGSTIEFDDDGGIGLDSLMTEFLEPGLYLVVIESIGGDGRYRVQVS